MKNIKHFKINLESEKLFYRPCDKVKGTLEIKCDQTVRVNSLTLDLLGSAKNDWWLKEINTLYQMVQFEIYFYTLIHFCLPRDNQGYFLKSGENCFPFDFDLPAGLLTSFEHEIGQRRYILKGKIEFSNSPRINAIRYISVLGDVDLNRLVVLSPSICFPVIKKDTKYVFFSCGGEIKCEFKINKSAFVPGEKVMCTAKIYNTSDRKVTRNSIKLCQMLNFAGSNSKYPGNVQITKAYKTLKTLTINKAIPGNTFDFACENKSFLIPGVHPTSGSEHIIIVKYFLIFEFGVFGSFSKQINIPITIGTIPITFGDSPSVFLPVYEKCKFSPQISGARREKTEGKVYDSNENSFKPVYPFYVNSE